MAAARAAGSFRLHPARAGKGSAKQASAETGSGPRRLPRTHAVATWLLSRTVV
jgi:hypothetical protein